MTSSQQSINRRHIMLIAALLAFALVLGIPQICHASLAGQTITVTTLFDDERGTITGLMPYEVPYDITFAAVGSSDSHTYAHHVGVDLLAATFTLDGPETIGIDIENLFGFSPDLSLLGIDLGVDLLADDIDLDGTEDVGNIVFDITGLDWGETPGEVTGVSIANAPATWSLAATVLSPSSIRVRFLAAELASFSIESFDIELEVQHVPEPTSAVLILVGVMACFGRRRRRRQRDS